MNYIFLIISMITMVIKNCIFNTAGKKILKNNADIFKFNSIMFLLCTVAFFALTINGRISWFTVLLGSIFGIATILSNVFTMKALASGTMHITVLITTSSMILPTVFGMIISNEPLNVGKMLAILILIFFIYLSSAKSETASVSKKWIVHCSIAFFAAGVIGIIQKIHQSSAYKDELFGFLCCSFAISFVLTLIIGIKNKSETKFNIKHCLLALICGVCVFTMNLINLKLSGIIPSQIFFPLVNGSSIIITSSMSIFIYKEKITKRQIVGLVGGLISLFLICVL